MQYEISMTLNSLSCKNREADHNNIVLQLELNY